MIQLRGKLTVQRIGGSINVVPTAGNPPLQGKIVFPSHEEQLVKPDDEYYGLSVVTVAAVPRIPCAEPIANYQSEIFVGRTIDLTGGVYTEVSEEADPYYYNREQLPEIPSDLKNMYPYIVIMRNSTYTRIYASKQKFYFYVDANGKRWLRTQSNAWDCRYTLNTDINQWVLDEARDTYYSFELSNIFADAPWYLWWSNHDIPNGSPEATEIYFPASEPMVDMPTVEPTHYYYAGLKYPKFPDEMLSDDYPYRAIFKWRDDGNIWAYACGKNDVPYYEQKSTLYSARFYPNGAIRALYNPESKTWGEVSANNGYLDMTYSWDLVWLESPIDSFPYGSSKPTDTYCYGMPSVPEPV